MGIVHSLLGWHIAGLNAFSGKSFFDNNKVISDMFINSY